MSTLVRALWLISDNDVRDEMIELAREGERLSLAMGAPPFTRSARGITNASDSSAIDQWSDDYAVQVDARRAMPLSVLWAGVSGWDPRADLLVMRLATAESAPWSVVLNRLRTAPAVVRQIADWFAARAVGLVNGNEQQVLQERAQRAWWSTYAATFPEPPRVGQTTGGVPSDANAYPLPNNNNNGGGASSPAGNGAPLGKIIVAAILFGLFAWGGGHRR